MKIKIFGIKNKNLKSKCHRFAINIANKYCADNSKFSQIINIIVVSDEHIISLNKKFLKRNQPTDVLSFPMQNQLPAHTTHSTRTSSDKDSFVTEKPLRPKCDVFLNDYNLLGEIYISFDRVKIQAQQQKITICEELCNLIKHGILHLLGYSHHMMKNLNNSHN